MTTREMMDSLSDALMHDERILSLQERELLANLLQRTKTSGSARNNAVAETIARAVGETIAQRAYGILGNNITQRLVENSLASGSASENAILARAEQPTLRMQGPSVGPPQPPAPPPPPGPQPPRRMQGPSVGPPQPPSPPPGPPRPGPQPPKQMQGPSTGPAPQPPAGPQPPHGPQPPVQPAPIRGPQPPRSTTVSETDTQASRVAVLERPDFISAQCVVLDEFLAPQELRELMQYTQDHEADFALSEVISPGVSGGAIDYNHRRSRVLMNLDKHRDAIVNRTQACLPQVLQKLGHDVFSISEVEAQITASNHGDFFRNHSDNLHEDTASRELTFVYFFHREPKTFRGGELRIYDSRWENGGYASTGNYQTVVPEQNQIVFFPSSLVHEISPVDCPSQAFADSRFTVNGWFHR
jgi:Rps23 Pro-64 3,4-dihydroxylase Tpa1-like proline 4-hydroxylase